MKSYCVKQRKKTDSVPGSERREIAKNGRPMIKSKCAECGSIKVRFISGGTNKGRMIRSDLSGGFIDIHKAIGKLPKPKSGWTLPGHKYTGPYNDLENQLRYDPRQERFWRSMTHPQARPTLSLCNMMLIIVSVQTALIQRSVRMWLIERWSKLSMRYHSPTDSGGIGLRETLSTQSKSLVWVWGKKVQKK